MPISTPFDTIESAQEYLRLLAEQVEEARVEVAADTERALESGADRRAQALQLAAFKLQQLSDHLGRSGRALNDLRLLRRILSGAADDVAAAAEPLPARSADIGAVRA